MQLARYGNKTFRAPESFTREDLQVILDKFHSGIPVTCPVCGAYDITPYTHWEFGECPTVGDGRLHGGTRARPRTQGAQ